jgi:hypothetical protein
MCVTCLVPDPWMSCVTVDDSDEKQGSKFNT